MVKPKYSVVIPTYNHLDDFLKPCLESIIKYTDLESTEVIVVANGCKDNTAGYVNNLTTTYPNIKLIEEKDGLGYTKATNIGIKASQGEYIVLLNNDTILLEQYKNQWLDMLEDPFKNDPLMGVTGPLWQVDKITKYRFIIFFCAMVPKKLFDELGILDEIFSPGSGEDIDFCIKTQLKGYKVQVVPVYTQLEAKDRKIVAGNFPIYHYAEGTFEHIEDYSSVTFKRNSLVNLKRYSTDIKLHLTSKNTAGLLPGHIKVHPSNPTCDILSNWNSLDFNDSTVEEVALMDSVDEIPITFLQDCTKEWNRVLKPSGRLLILAQKLSTAVIIQAILKSKFKVEGTQEYNDKMFIQASKL